MPAFLNRRILLVDDTPTIHQDFRKILMPVDDGVAELDEMEAMLFGEQVKTNRQQPFELDSAYTGAEGLTLVKQALAGQ
jgi:DNA-binding NtrC family response regulator